MKNAKQNIITILVLTFLTPLSTWGNTSYKYCVHVDAFNLSPYREIKDGKELGYLENLFPSFISTEKDEMGVLSSYEFSPDGKIFRAKINNKITWSNGEIASPQDIMFSFLKSFSYRPLAERIQIIGLNNKLSSNLKIENIGKIEGFKWMTPDTFEIKFNSEISNITGVIREALSTGSNQNRFWIEKKDKDNKTIYISRHPIQSVTPTQIDIKVLGENVSLVSNPKCAQADMGFYPPALKADMETYDKAPSPMKTAITAVFNTKLSKDERKELAQLIKLAFTPPNLPAQFTTVESFFVQGDPGYDETQPWSQLVGSYTNKKSYKIFYEVPIYKDIMIKICPECTYIPTGDASLKNADVQLLSSTISGGRHIMLQDLLEWELIKEFLKFAPHTTESLQDIAKVSASTIPPSSTVLKKFEIETFNEMSVMPVARRVLYAYTKKNLPIRLDFNAKGELVFRKNISSNKH